MKRIKFFITAIVLSTISFNVFAQVKFQENIIAGSESDFMLVKHYVIKGTNYEIGESIAEIAKRMHLSLNTHSDPVRNKLRTQYFKMNYPIHYERMKGIAAGFGADCNNFANNISEIPNLPIKTNCSVVFYPKNKTQNNHNLLSRNFDFPTGNLQMQKCEGNELPVYSRPIIFEVYPDTGYSSLYICSGELAGGVFDGINSQGLSVAILGDGGRPNDGLLPEPEIGLHELLIMRYLLDNCKNTAEAKEALLYLKQYYSFAPLHYIIADNEGHSFIFEFSRMRNQSHVIDGTGIQCITNHLISDQTPGQTPGESKYRLELLERLTSGDKKYTLEEIKNINSQVSPPLTQNYGPNLAPCRTLWHSIYDMDEKSLMVKFYLGEEVQPDNSIKAKYSDYYEIKLSK
jgi:predicted choloylglycine hydrolase